MSAIVTKTSRDASYWGDPHGQAVGPAQPRRENVMEGCETGRIERIIRRVAGSLVLVGLALGTWVHPGWLLLSAFVGVNLLQSSFTGFCPLESILRRRESKGASPGQLGANAR
jgi:hypothetical protein